MSFTDESVIIFSVQEAAKPKRERDAVKREYTLGIRNFSSSRILRRYLCTYVLRTTFVQVGSGLSRGGSSYICLACCALRDSFASSPIKIHVRPAPVSWRLHVSKFFPRAFVPSASAFVPSASPISISRASESQCLSFITTPIC